VMHNIDHNLQGNLIDFPGTLYHVMVTYRFDHGPRLP
jgi:hypothetical protein